MPVARSTTQPLGVVYTPPDVARAMTRLALAPLVENASSSELLALRVCDPAAGEGAFLVEVVAFLAEHLVAAWKREGREASPTWEHEAREIVVRTCIVGVDIDEAALAVASRALVENASIVRDRSQVRKGAAPVHDALRVADALSLDWRIAFPDIFAAGGFDAVLANPPYIRQENLESKSSLEDFEVYDGVADLYVYFLELAHRLVRPRGRYCVIVPNKWMTAEYGRPLREFLASAHTIDGVLDLSTHPLFANADAFPCIVWGTMGASRDRPVVGVRANANENIDTAVHRASSALDGMPRTSNALDGTGGARAAMDDPRVSSTGDAVNRVSIIGDGVNRVSTAGDGVNRASSVRAIDDIVSRGDAIDRGGVAGTIPRDRWSADPWHIDSSSDHLLLERLARAYPTLGDVIGTRWSRGVVTGLNDAFVIDREMRDAFVATDRACEAWMRPFIKGRDIRPYVTRPPGAVASDTPMRARAAPTFDTAAARASSDTPVGARAASPMRVRTDAVDRWILLVDRGTSFDDLPAPIRDHLSRFRERLEPRPADHVGAWAGRKPGAYAWHELQDPVVPLAKSRAPRFFYQDIQTAPACSFDPDGELVPDTTVWILPSSDRYLLAILNSPLYHWYARRRFPPALNGAVRPKLAYMQRLPIPTPSRDLRREIEALVDRRIAATDTRVIDTQLQRFVEMAYELSSIERALIAE